MPATKEFERELIPQLPHLRAFAMSMTRNRTEAEDLVQETVLTALEKCEEYELGTNMKAWLFRLQVLIDSNKKRKEARQRSLSRGRIEDPETATIPPSQIDSLLVTEAQAAVDMLPLDQRQALFLVAYDGKSYDEAGDILACSAGTVKSRVSRARARIAELINYEHASKNTKELEELKR